MDCWTPVNDYLEKSFPKTFFHSVNHVHPWSIVSGSNILLHVPVDLVPSVPLNNESANRNQDSKTRVVLQILAVVPINLWDYCELSSTDLWAKHFLGQDTSDRNWIPQSVERIPAVGDAATAQADKIPIWVDFVLPTFLWTPGVVSTGSLISGRVRGSRTGARRVPLQPRQSTKTAMVSLSTAYWNIDTRW